MSKFTAPPVAPAAISIDAFCQAVGIGRTHCYAQIRDKKITALKSGRRTLVPMTEVSAYLSRLPTKVDP